MILKARTVNLALNTELKLTVVQLKKMKLSRHKTPSGSRQISCYHISKYLQRICKI